MLPTNGKAVILCKEGSCCPQLTKLPSGLYLLEEGADSIFLTEQQIDLIFEAKTQANDIFNASRSGGAALDN